MTAGWAPGPNHPDYGRSFATRPVQRPGRKPIGRTTERQPYTLPQLIREYARSHDRQAGGECRCDLCSDLRWHQQQARQKRQSGGAK